MKSTRLVLLVPFVPFVPFALFACLTARADITGTVVDDVSGDPIADARVRIRTDTGPPVLSDAAGAFTLTGVPAGPVTVTAGVSYDSANAVNYVNNGVGASDGDNVEIRLTLLPAADTANYDPGSPLANCGFCHDEQVTQWSDSNHSNAGQNEWVLDLYAGTGTPGGANGYVFRDTHDPDETGFCASCHTPIEDAQDPGNVFFDEADLTTSLFGVSCLACHQMAEVNDTFDAINHLGNTTYRFPDSGQTHFWVWGPLDDVITSPMRPSHQPDMDDSRYCAGCHEYDNPDTGAPGQTTYSEWLASPYAQPGPDFRSCQDCHMPTADSDGPISSLGGAPVRDASQRHSHEFIGSTPTTLAEAIDLQVSASQAGPQLQVSAEVTNAGAGHDFPAGVSIRNAILVIEASVGGTPLDLLSGPVVPFYGSADGGNGPDDLAGRPGRGYARVLEGRINGAGPVERPVLFIDAEGVWADTSIPSGETDSSQYVFDVTGLAEGTVVDVNARLVYRRAWRYLSEIKGWTQTPTGGPIEIEVGNESAPVTVSGDTSPVIPVPALGTWAMIVLAISLVLMTAGVGRAMRAPDRR